MQGSKQPHFSHMRQGSSGGWSAGTRDTAECSPPLQTNVVSASAPLEPLADKAAGAADSAFGAAEDAAETAWRAAESAMAPKIGEISAITTEAIELATPSCKVL